MVLIDANVILRYLLDDVEELALQAAAVIDAQSVFVPTEVFAEVVYVLEKVYKIDRTELCCSLLKFLEHDHVITSNKSVIETALRQYSERSLDFVDMLLYAYHKVEQYQVFTFDKKLERLIQGT
ncbi:MAG: PIN domain-containing protein [Negativicutes bacterium]|nr:PIN domain-containing protein [Negativicutes bacterium]